MVSQAHNLFHSTLPIDPAAGVCLLAVRYQRRPQPPLHLLPHPPPRKNHDEE
jgi:hypothetical protein